MSEGGPTDIILSLQLLTSSAASTSTPDESSNAAKLAFEITARDGEFWDVGDGSE